MVVLRGAWSRGRRPAPAGAGRGPRDAVSAGPGSGGGHPGGRPVRGRSADGPADGGPDHGPAAGGRAGPARRDGLHHGLDPGAPGERYQVVVHVEARCWRTRISPASRPRGRGARFRGNVPAPGVRCEPGGDAVRRRRAPRGDRGPDRTILPALRRALQHRDRGCRFPGSGGVRPGHHLRHWRKAARHALEPRPALSPAPPRGARGRLSGRSPAGRALRFRRPDGRPLAEVPPPAAVPADPVQALRARHEAQGLAPARTACPSWAGERLDLGWRSTSCIPWPREVRPRPSLGDRRSWASSPSATVLAAEASLMSE